jgi:tRNA pseudouridine55 synthase
MEHGLLLIDKDPGLTSHDVVQQVRRLLRQKRVGHCGTLDPDATGLLPLTLGRATRLTRFLIEAPKVYEGSIRFGIATDTYDASGQVVTEHSTQGLTLDAIEGEMSRWVGTREQMPPPYCARKHEGKKYYELARQGKEVPRTAKMVTIFELSPIGDLKDDVLAFRLSCSSGTYARTLADDLGKAMDCGGHLSSLRRTQVGKFQVSSAITVEALERRLDAGEQVGEAFYPFDTIPLPFGEVQTDQQQERRVLNGQTIIVRDLQGEEGDWVKLTNQRSQFIAVGSVTERIGRAGVGIVQPRVVFS